MLDISFTMSNRFIDYCDMAQLTWKQMLSAQHLCEDTPNRPHVNSSPILHEGQQDLRGAVPSGSHVLGHVVARLVGGLEDTSGHTCSTKHNAKSLFTHLETPFNTVNYFWMQICHFQSSMRWHTKGWGWKRGVLCGLKEISRNLFGFGVFLIVIG